MDAKLLLAIAVMVGMGVAAAFERRAKARARDAKSAPSAVLIVVKTPDSVSTTERVAKYDEPLGVALTRESLGKVIGSTADLTVEVIDFARGLPFLKRELLRLGVPRDTTLQFKHFGVQVAESVMALDLEPGRRYRVIKAFMDHDRDAHPEGEEWTFLRSAFVPYHSGLSWFVSADGVQETHIRMQSTPEEQGNILSNLAEYLVAV
jgi:hypothetical protein